MQFTGGSSVGLFSSDDTGASCYCVIAAHDFGMVQLPGFQALLLVVVWASLDGSNCCIFFGGQGLCFSLHRSNATAIAWFLKAFLGEYQHGFPLDPADWVPKLRAMD